MGGGGPSSGRGRDLHPQQLVGEDVPEDGEEEEGDEGEDDDPPGALLLQTLLVAAQDQQAHADAHHGPRQVRHEAGLGPRRGQRRREAQPDGATHLGTHCGGTQTSQESTRMDKHSEVNPWKQGRALQGALHGNARAFIGEEPHQVISTGVLLHTSI